MDKPLIISHLEKSLDFTLFDCKWIPKTGQFTIVGSKTRGSGVIQVLEVAPNELTTIKEIETPHAVKCSTFGASGYGQKNLATGDFVGNLDIWDLETSLKVYNVKAHNEIINAIDGIGGVTCGSPEIATGSKDGSVKVWDIRQKDRPVAIIQNPDGENQRDCWAVGFGNTYNNEERMLCSGYDNGDVKLFDLKTMKLVWEHNVTNGVCSIEFDRKDIPINKLLITTLESKFHVFDCRTFHPHKGYSCLTEKAHNSTIWSIKHLPQDRDIFMTTGGSGSLCLWRYKYPEARVKKDVSDGKDVGVMGNVELLQNSTLSTQPISSFAWSPDKKGLGVSTSFDQCVRLIIVTKLNLF